MKVTRTIPAPRSAVYAAFVDANAFAAWIAPAGMHAEMHRFDARSGGGYRMTLHYDAATGRGKTTANADTVDVRFVEIVDNTRIVQAVDFESADAAFGGTMTMTWTFSDVPGGTEIGVVVDNPPPGVSDADHELGIRSSLDNLARSLARR